MQTQKLIFAALLFLLSTTGIGQQEQRSVLLPAHEAKAVSDLYSQERAEKIKGSWNPTKADLDGLEANLSEISEMKIYGWDSKIHIDHPAQYYRQYIAVLVAGKRMIFINAFCDAQGLPDWHDRMVIVSDGATCFWQVLYDPVTKQFSNLRINARA